MMKQAVLAVALFTIFFATTSVANKSPELRKIQSRITQVNQTIAQIKRNRENLLLQLQAIEKQYGTTAGSLHELNSQIETKQQHLQTIQQQIKQRQAELAVENAALGRQIKTYFVMGRKEKLRLLLNQQDPSMTSRVMVYYEYLNRTRLKKLAAIKNSLKFLAKLQQDKQQEAQSLVQAISSHERKKTDLDQTKVVRETLLAQLNTAFALKSRQLNDLEENVKASQALIDDLQRAALAREALEKKAAETPQVLTEIPLDNKTAGKVDDDGNLVKLTTPSSATSPVETSSPFVNRKGRLFWPIHGTIVKKFGSPRSDTRWDGVLIAAKEGTEIHAVAEGHVAFADWLRGYGLLMIVDHGGGYMTLYAFSQSLYKKVGDSIKTGMVLGAVGNSDGREESGLYFGIRNKGKAVDPVKWCR